MRQTSQTPGPWSSFEVGLVTLEFETAFAVGNAEGDPLVDAVFVTDASGLPCIPGETIAGILRHALAGAGDPETDETCRRIFGYQQGNAGDSSRLRVSFAHVHGANDEPVPFRGASLTDPVLTFLAAGADRDHVRIGPAGAVDGRGKFDERVVPAGARFTFELCLARGEPGEGDMDLATLVTYLGRPGVRIGRGTRRGLGRCEVRRFRCAAFDLSNRSDLDRLARLPSAIPEMARSDILEEAHRPEPQAAGTDWIRGHLRLEPKGTWVVGGGLPREGQSAPTSKASDRDRPVERWPLSERRIQWSRQTGGDIGHVVPLLDAGYLLPGSAVKGALRHRTAFHARRILKNWYDPLDPSLPDPHPAEVELFGEVRGKKSGQPGRVYFSDTYVATAPLVALDHVSLDRFTQGPMDHMLFDERALGASCIEVDILLHRGEGAGKLGDTALQAFRAALDDLCQGRLTLGAGRGHGFFQGELSGELMKITSGEDVRK